MVEWMKLVAVSDVLYGYPFESSQFSEDSTYMPLIRIRDVKPAKASTYYSGEFNEVYRIKKGNILVGMDGEFNLGKWNDRDGLLNQRVLKLKGKDGYSIDGYLFHYMGPVFKKIEKETAGGSVKHLSAKVINSILIPIPSLEEQTRIVGILDTFTSAIDNLKEQIALRRKQYEYYRDQLLDLEGKPGVEMKTLGEVCGIFDGTHQTPNYVESGIKFVSVENIKDIYSSCKYISIEDYQKNYKVKPQKGDVLMTRIGDVGSCAVVDGDEPIAYYVSLALLRPSFNIVLSNYVKYILESKTGKIELRKRTLLIAVPLKINLGDIGKIKLPFPDISTQFRIVSILDTFEASIQNLEAQLKEREKQYEYYRNKLLTFE